MHNLNVINLPLYGTKLIEASAGTGKTYVLVILYLRLLLNLENTSSVLRKPLNIKEILVVTFTNAAANSLRHRIRENIQQFRLDCIRGYSNNYFFSQLLTQIHDINMAINQLLEAEKKINQASIFTIHGFCQNILMQNTVELNTLFDVSITNNEKELCKQACIDFWRKYFYPLPLNIITLIQEYWPNPDYLIKDISPYIYGELPKIYPPSIIQEKIDIPTYYTLILTNIKNIKKKWNDNINDIVNIIHKYNINRKIYNKKNLENWINKINQWIQQPTTDHIIPNDLKRFRSSILQENTNCNTIYIHSLFNQIEKLHLQLLSFKSLIFNIAIHKIQKNLKKIKYFTSEITFTDLIDLLACNLTKNKKNNLTQKIRIRYPIAIIDEFQDTDPQQYKIFYTIYFNHIKNGLILIGDPKQAIYSFRRADIFTYIKARRSIHNKYNLNINWRSSSNMTNAINQLFQYTKNPFIFNDIPFTPSIPAHHNNTYQFSLNNKLQTAMCFWVHPKEIVTIEDYKKTMAQECAIILHNLLYAINKKTAWISKNHYKRILKASDITILVRNHEEASLIKSTLSELNISTVFLSNQKNIFKTTESYDMFLLLQAIFFLDHNMIQTALTTIFFKFNAVDIEKTKNNESYKNTQIEKFSEYHSIWKKNGIYSMICTILFSYKIPEKLLSSKKGEDKLINILHLSELLQNKSIQLNKEYELIQWLVYNITQSHKEYTSAEQLLRLNHDHQFIKISTIHKSKGLEFPLTFLPFITNINYKKTPFFHDRKSYTTYFNFNQSISHIKLTEEECLSEELRLLYVAITRSIYHCSIGIAPIICKKYKKNNTINDLHRSALGYLIQQKNPGNAEYLKTHLNMLKTHSRGDISFYYIDKSKKMSLKLPKTEFTKKYLSSKSWTPLINTNPWTITSYSQLKFSNQSIIYSTQKIALNINENTHNQKKEIVLTPHTFPKGKICGKFFHRVFELLDFTKPIDLEWLKIYTDKYNFDSHWIKIIQKWIYCIVNTPLNNKNLTLSQISSANKKTELKFYFPINTNLTPQTLHSLCKHYDPLSFKSLPHNFSQIHGMLQGFIDLVFRWDQKYYFIDYKTNWLGENYIAYNQLNIEKEMIKKCYTLQYQLYTLALHRFLKYRIASYNYKKDFGGIYYLFIRGINASKYNNGIYFIRPLSSIFIKKLDNLFSGK